MCITNTEDSKHGIVAQFSLKKSVWLSVYLYFVEIEASCERLERTRAATAVEIANCGTPTCEFKTRLEIQSTVESWSENSRSRRIHSADLPSCFLMLPSDLLLCPALHGLGLTISLLARSWRFALLAIFAGHTSDLFLGTRFAARSAAIDHPPRRFAPPLQGWKLEQE